MYELCFLSKLTSSEWAAWFQAIASVVAIVAGGVIATWQSRLQHRSAIQLHAAEQRYACLERARSLSVIAGACADLVAHLERKLNDGESNRRVR